jgi:rare lipoprotein A
MNKHANSSIARRVAGLAAILALEGVLTFGLTAPMSLARAAPESSAAPDSSAAPESSAPPEWASDRSGAREGTRSRQRPARLSPLAKPQLDRSGRRRTGKASFYAKSFAGRKMADGSPMEPTGNNAASRTLPLGTTARVTNLETGKAAIVTIRDRGPYVAGRIVDLSPATAREIGLKPRTGVTRVAVSPITVPLPNGKIKFGDGVLEATNRIDRDNRVAAAGS